MIYVECSVVSLTTAKIISRYIKQFSIVDDFTKWYTLAKKQPDVIINVMKYNPMEKTLQKHIYDDRLLSVPRSVAT